MRAHSLAGGVGVPPRVAAQGAVDAGEAVTPDARGQADDGRAGVADGWQPGSQAARRDAALGRVVVEQGADRVQEAGMLRPLVCKDQRRSQRETGHLHDWWKMRRLRMPLSVSRSRRSWMAVAAAGL